ncbi:MAG: glutamine--fructose-6-phosphate transaminase (isomerizing) [Clostridiaceae bacterium]|jgi:glucosamine--fructose-6-phosphate aminotransferase (isomerizing)|nr:glutamine--fructose-6-phosphate transaminase (isomerizing) [Oscillospiraceae bacterium]NLO62405.1 glutamine--fructose-6-phosphate transaminase (isomerizing) [Clostridiaceae bacterium]
MCGIVGYVGDRDALPILIKGLKKLEYRGYDSSGVTFLEDDRIRLIKKKGRIEVLENSLKELGYNTDFGHEQEKKICLGMGHTRWATHGAPSDENAHPHLSDRRHVCVIHNGIIENYTELRGFLIEKGVRFLSETDSEVAAHLIEYHYLTNCNADLFSAVQAALMEIEGSYALVVLCTEHPDLLIAAKKDNPLIIGYGEGANYIASDIPAVIEYTRNVLIVEDNEIAVVRRDSVELFTVHGQKVERDTFRVDWDAEAAEKGGFEHFMMKEIFEEPSAVKATISSRIRSNRIVLDGFPLNRDRILKASRIHFVACGTAYHAGCVGKNIIEKVCRIPVEVDVASEFRYKDPIIDENSIVIIISQSGETLDTLAAMREAKRRGALTISIVNVVGSSIARESDYVLYTAAGPEISVASTKAYLTQLSCIYLMAFEMARIIGRIDQAEYEHYLDELILVPEKISLMLEKQSEIQRFASEHFNAKSIFFIGRGLDYFLSMEASLKLKEISYIHSEAYPGGELKHGTIALIEKGTLVVCSLTQDRLLEKMISNISEVKARGAVVLGITSQDKENAIRSCDEAFTIPPIDPILAPMLAVTPCQLFAYYMAVNKGCDVDKPRNLAKSVTVE